MMDVHMLLLLLAFVPAQAEESEIPWIQWKDGCDEYDVTTDEAPYVNLFISTGSTLSECRANCTARTHCGGFTVAYACLLHNINDDVLNQYVTADATYYYYSGITWYSKTCQYDLGCTDLACNSYIDTLPANTHIERRAYQLFTETRALANVTATFCHELCTLYTACKSVRFMEHPDQVEPYHSECQLFNTTVGELLAAGMDDSVRTTNPGASGYTWTSYDRRCADGSPYIPTVSSDCTRPTTTTTRPNPGNGGNPGKGGSKGKGGGGGGCLHGEEQVTTADGMEKKVKDIALWDKVMVVDDEGSIQFQTMYIDIHHNPNKQNVQFVRIETNNNLTITVTPKHLIYSGNGLVAAEKIKIGDPVITYDKFSTALSIERVTDISQVIHDGVYNPLVKSGRVLVGHILASTYPDMAPFTAQHQHYILWPIRQILGHSTGSQFITNILVDWNYYHYTNYILENVVLVVYEKMFF